MKKSKAYYLLRSIYHKVRRFFDLKERTIKNKIGDSIGQRVSASSLSGKFFEEKKAWYESLLQMLEESSGQGLDNLEEVLVGFFDEPIEKIKNARGKDSYEGVVAVSAIKNDLVYLKELLPYYRQMGVKHFAFIDNGSTDDSLEYLMQQDDVSLYQAKYQFKGRKKAGWKLQVVAELGMHRWYLWLDSDEFIVYKGMEHKDINQFTSELLDAGYRASHGFMLDMYPKYPLMDGVHKNEDFFGDYVYFDPYNSFYEIAPDTGVLTGGMRSRVMNARGLRLDKYPLIYCCEKHVPFGNHGVSGLKISKKDEEYTCLLKHYKFLPEQTEKYRKIAQGGSGYINQDALKKYFNPNGEGFVAFDLNSEFFSGSDSMKSFPFFK